MNDPLDSAIPVGSGPGTTVPPSSTPPPPPAAPAAPNTPRGSDKVWAILSHVSGFMSVPILLPLVVYLAMKDESAYVRDNAKEALNFHISLLIYGLCLLPLMWLLIGIPLAFVLLIGAFVLSVIAAIRASEGRVYRYPLTLRLVK